MARLKVGDSIWITGRDYKPRGSAVEREAVLKAEFDKIARRTIRYFSAPGIGCGEEETMELMWEWVDACEGGIRYTNVLCMIEQMLADGTYPESLNKFVSRL